MVVWKAGRFLTVVGILTTVGSSAAVLSARDKPPKPKTLVLQGRVVQLGLYLKETWGIPMDASSGNTTMVLVTTSGDIHPILKDERSRGYFMDNRLRGRSMELHVYKYPKLPYVRLIDAFSFKEGRKHKVDYWCTICSISTFEPGPCPCCQDDIELRERRADPFESGQ